MSETQEFNAEKMRSDIAERIRNAKDNALSEERLAEFEDKLRSYQDLFIKNGQRNPEDIAEEDQIEAEILRSSAVADTLNEFREVLEQIKANYFLGEEWVNNLVEHENAHANVAQATGHEWVGYGAVFIKDANGQLSNIQPVHFTKPNLSWGPREVITKNIEVTEAPALYGNSLSEGDEKSVEEDQERLKRIDETRKRLGI